MNESNLGKSLVKFGTIKKLYLHINGFRIKGVNKDITHYWNSIESVKYYWEISTTNVFAYNHEFTLAFFLKGQKENIVETWRPGSIYVNFPKRKIHNVLNTINACGIRVIQSDDWLF